jgi:hypothetical protein
MPGEPGLDVGERVRVILVSTDPQRGFMDFGPAFSLTRVHRMHGRVRESVFRESLWERSPICYVWGHAEFRSVFPEPGRVPVPCCAGYRCIEEIRW